MVPALHLGDGATMFESTAICLQSTAVQAVLAERRWLVDDRFGVADVMCASVLQGAHSRGQLAPWPALEAYLRRGEARPAYARAAAIWDRPRS